MTLTTDWLTAASRQQAAYREILRALSYPGRVIPMTELDRETVAQAGSGHSAADGIALVLATLLDEGTSLADRTSLVSPDLQLLLGYSEASVENADFVLALGSEPLSPEPAPRLGSIYQPQLGATLIVVCKRLGSGPLAMQVAGPGVRDVQDLCVDGLDPQWLHSRLSWVARFPMGVDLLLCDGSNLVGLPRTSKIEFPR